MRDDLDRPASFTFPALGTTVTVATVDPGALDGAVEIVRRAVRSLDRAASRFRVDSELAALQRAGGRPVAISDELFVALDQALVAARDTGGLLDPTVGHALELCGYDRDFSEVLPSGPPLTVHLRPVPGYRFIRLDRRRRTAAVPAGIRLDLGATAKAGCADRAAAAAAGALGSGVLVSLGGDIALGGAAPPDGWTVRVADRHDAGPGEPGVTVALRSGGLATSGTAARHWRRGGRLLHHVIDPATGSPAAPCWRTVTVGADTCLSANVGSTASLLLGPAAPAWLAERGLHARLVGEDGTVVGVGGWPAGALEPAPGLPVAVSPW